MSTDIDLTAVQRVLDNQAPTPTLTRSERLYVTGLLTADEVPAGAIAKRLGVSKRTVVRWRKHSTPSATIAQDMPLAAWRDNALCAQIGGDYFFAPDDDTDDDTSLYSSTRARAICIRCPVRTACLDDAMTREGNSDRHHRSGVWGGLTSNQRAALARARQSTAPTAA